MFRISSGLRPPARLAGTALALGLALGLFAGPASAATCNPSSVTTAHGIAAKGCGTEQPFAPAFSDKIDDVGKGSLTGSFFSIAVTRTKGDGDAIGGTWSLKPGLSFAQGATYALALKGGTKTVFYTLDTSANSGTWSTADLLVGKNYRQAGLSNIRMTGTAAPVPLPAAAWLLVGGVAGIGALVRRRKGA